jgi:hypothetical protein
VNDADEILGLMDDGLAADTAPAPELPSLNLSLSLTDEDLEQKEIVFKTIPTGTRTDFELYLIEVKPYEKGDIKTIQWAMTLRAVSDEWGSGKQLRYTVRFSPKEKFNWGPFLKAIGYLDGAGTVQLSDLADPNTVARYEGHKISLKILGTQWKDENGSYYRDHGKHRTVRPKHIERFFEEVGYPQRTEAASAPPADELSGLGQFDPSNYQ